MGRVYFSRLWATNGFAVISRLAGEAKSIMNSAAIIALVLQLTWGAFTRRDFGVSWHVVLWRGD